MSHSYFANNNKYHAEAISAHQPMRRPTRDIVVCCMQPNGFTIQVRAYSESIARFEEAALRSRGVLSRRKRHQSAYAGLGMNGREAHV